MSERIKKVNELIREVLSVVIEVEIGSEHGMFTVMSVHTSPDLKNATVWISYLGKLEEKEALELLNKNIYEIQQQFNKKVTLKFTPKIYFKIDHSVVAATRIEKILEEEREKGNANEAKTSRN